MAGPGGGTSDERRDVQVDNIFNLFMAGHVVLDSMVPLYFAIHGIADKFRGIFKDRSHLPSAVFRELDGLTRGRGSGATFHQIPRWFRIHEITDSAMAERVLDRQRRWRGKEAVEDDPRPDRGEAECLELCVDLGHPLLTHDHQALADAARDGIETGTTIDVLAIMVLRAMFQADKAWLVYTSFVRAGLHPVRDYPPDATGEARFTDLILRCRARQRPPPPTAAPDPATASTTANAPAAAPAPPERP